MARYINSGDLDKQVTLQSVANTNDGMGGVTEVWTDQYTTFASIDPPKAREFFANGQVQSEITTRIRIRYRPSVAHKWRVKYGTRYFNINSVINPDECNQELILMCTEQFAT